MQLKTAQTRLSAVVPAWLPDAARNYLIHTEIGLSIRALARAEGCHASTVLRQVRRLEGQRDDPLFDAALKTLGRRHFAPLTQLLKKGDQPMGVQVEIDHNSPESRALDAECFSALSHLVEKGAVLAVAKDMEKSVIVREDPKGENLRSAVISADVAQSLSLRGWIETVGATGGRITRYKVSSVGRAAAKGPHQGTTAADDTPERRFSMVESPLVALARRRDKDGNPLLDDVLVRAGERLREDYELAGLDPATIEAWLAHLAGHGDEPKHGGDDPHRDPEARFFAAVLALGSGLADAALRCCCLMEGMEQVERRMGWSARSGKIVLRIALNRLQQHYVESFGIHGPLIY